MLRCEDCVTCSPSKVGFWQKVVGPHHGKRTNVGMRLLSEISFLVLPKSMYIEMASVMYIIKSSGKSALTLV